MAQTARCTYGDPADASKGWVRSSHQLRVGSELGIEKCDTKGLVSGIIGLFILEAAVDPITAANVRGTRAEAPAGKLKVFISYSRSDAAFADELVSGLDFDGGFDVSIDRQAIQEGEDWKTRLGVLILSADTIVFVLSKKSAASPICAWEVDEAHRNAKRILPVLVEPVGGAPVPTALAELNYVRFDEGRSFMVGLTALRHALKTDIAWLREHTRLMERAREWDAAGRVDNRMLAGSDIKKAKEWLQHRPADAPEITELHRDFIQASDRTEALRLSAERQRAEALQRAVKRTRVALAGAMLFAVAAGVAGWLARVQQKEAEKQRTVAEQTRAVAEQAKAAAEQQRTVAELAQAAAEEANTKAAGLLKEVLQLLPDPWPEDALSPDYRHLSGAALGRDLRGGDFLLTGQAIEVLLQANSFVPAAPDGKIVVILRGAELIDASMARTAIPLKDVRPDLVHFRSVVVVYDRRTATLSAFQGSSEPNKLAMYNFSKTGRNGNLLPTGSLAYCVGSQRQGKYKGVLRQCEDIAVRRSAGGLRFETNAKWDGAFVADNLHPSFEDTNGISMFSSFGSVTISGGHTGDTPTGQFEQFRRALGLAAPGSDDGKNIGVVLLTGLDASIAAHLLAANETISPENERIYLLRLRHGSHGDRVKTLQTALGLQPTGNFDRDTTLRLAGLQNEKLGWSDGIYSAEMDRLLGFCVFGGDKC